MRILATADLHGREDWYQWLAMEAHNQDLIVIAGDLIDRSDDVVPQIKMVISWMREIAQTGVAVLLCSGNHDVFPLPLDSQWDLEFDAVLAGIQGDSWIDVLPFLHPRCWVNGTRYLGDHHLILTSVPFGADDNAYLRAMKMGRLIKDQFELIPVWIVAHHVPPTGNLASGRNGCPNLACMLEMYQPHLVFCGHDHSAPLRSGRCVERHGYTRVYNPGFNYIGHIPCHLTMETTTFRYHWHR
jgi:Icc-related predicted phosphoesterase